MFCSKCGKETTENAMFCSGCGTSLTNVQSAKKTRFRLAAGIIDIAAGGFVALMAIIFIVIVVAAGAEEGSPGSFVLFVLFTLGLAVMSVLAIVGGIFALRRRNWAMALTGAIAASLTSSLLGVAALVLTIMAKDEFE